MITFRIAAADDFEKVVELNSRLFEYDNQWSGEYDEEWPRKEDGQRYFQNVVTSKDGNICFIAENGETGEVVGYLAGNLQRNSTVFKRPSRAELENMYVVKEYRSRGVGAKLVAKFVEYCKKHGKDTVKVVASVENTKAVEFYKNNGFKPRYLELDRETL